MPSISSSPSELATASSATSSSSSTTGAFRFSLPPLDSVVGNTDEGALALADFEGGGGERGGDGDGEADDRLEEAGVDWGAET